MNIQITEDGRNINISLPTNLVTSRFVLGFLLKHAEINGRKLEGVSANAAGKLAEELKRIKQKHGAWELVEVYGSKGETVKITL